MAECDSVPDERSPLLSPSLSPGTRFIVAADAAAVIMCRRRQPICCLRSNLEFFSIPDGSVVEILQPNISLFGSERRERVVGVRVLASINSELNGVLGSIRLRWLHAYGDFLSAVRATKASRSRKDDVALLKQTDSWWPVPRISRRQRPDVTNDVDEVGRDRQEGCLEQAPSMSELDQVLMQIGINRNLETLDPSFDFVNPIAISTILSRLQSIEYDLDGDVIRSLAKTLFGSLPLDIDGIRIRRSKIGVRLRQRQTISIPTSSGFVLDQGRLMPRPVQVRRLALRDEIEIDLGQDGTVIGIRPGDISVVKGPVSLGVKVRTERHPGRIDTDDKGRAIVAVDQHGQAIRDSTDGEYRLSRYDDWIVVSVLGKSHWIGVSPINPKTLQNSR